MFMTWTKNVSYGEKLIVVMMLCRLRPHKMSTAALLFATKFFMVWCSGAMPAMPLGLKD